MAVDYSKLSDEELDAMLAAKKPKTKDYSTMSDEELDAMLASKKEKKKLVETKPRDVSTAESALSGAAQGVSMGFGDELSGAAGALAGKLGLVPDMGYGYYRDFARNRDKQAQEANPKTYGAGQIGGGISTLALPGVAMLQSGGNAVKGGALLGGLTGAGSTESDILSEQGAKDIALGGAIGAGGGALGNLVGKVATGSPSIVNRIKDYAARMAETATGATGKQASRFAPGAGRDLLDMGLVKAFDRPSNVAERLLVAQTNAGNKIGQAIQSLDEKGAMASRSNVATAIEKEIEKLRPVSGTEDLVSKLEKEIERLRLKEDAIPLSLAEQSKRQFNSNVNFASPEYDKTSAAILGRAFRNEVEKVAESVDPRIAKNFTDEKKIFGLLAPIADASQARAMQQQMSPIGGLLDTVSMMTGGANPAQMIAMATLRRGAAPRIASTAAVGADKLGNLLQGVGNVVGGAAIPTQAATQAASLGMSNKEIMDALRIKRKPIKGGDYLRSKFSGKDKK